MKSITYQIFLIAFTLQLDLAKAQPDEQPGLHSEGGPWKFYSYLHERLSKADDIKSAVKHAQKAFTEGSNLRFKNPNEVCQFQKVKTDGINQKVKPSNY